MIELERTVRDLMLPSKAALPDDENLCVRTRDRCGLATWLVPESG